MKDDATPRGSLSPRAYAWVGIGLSLLITALVGGYNLVVDPYDWFDIDIEGFNARKAVAYGQDRIFKIRDVTRERPDVSAIGTSRLGLGLHHSHPALGPTSYNMGLTAAGIYECFRNLQHLQALRPQRRAVVGLDFIQFDSGYHRSPAFKEDRLRVDRLNRLQPGSYWADVPAILWSTDACIDSAKTIGANWRPKGLDLVYDRGAIDERGMENWIRRQVVPKAFRAHVTNGYRWAFLDLVNDYLKKYHGFSYRDKDGTKPMLAHVRAILDFARAEGIELHLFITPAHAWLGQVYHASGNWGAFREWKRDLAALVAEEAVEAGGAPFPLWDFATYATITQEEPPPFDAGPKVHTRWYWEASHFRRELGDLVLDRMFGTAAGSIPVPEDFGTDLNAVDLDDHLAEVDRRRDAWAQAHPASARSIEDFFLLVDHNLTGAPLPERLEAVRQQFEQAHGQ